MRVQTELMSFAEFEKVADPPEGRYELHHGQIAHMPPRKKEHVKAQQALFELLLPVLRGLGFLAPEFPFRPASEFEAWQAGIGFVWEARWKADQNDYFWGAPDFVIEVLSKSNTMDEILDRQDICFGHGCQMFWTVDPKRRIVIAATPDRRTITFDASMAIAVPFALDHLILVAQIFQA